MTPRPLCDAERAAIAARYGVRMDLVPASVVVCPPRTYAIDPTVVDGWQAATAAKKERMAREARMAALKRRERKAEAKAAEPAPMVMVKAGKPRLSDAARERKNAKRRAERASRAVIARSGSPTAAELEWLRLVTDEGMTHQDAAERVGRARTGCQKIAAKLRAHGHQVIAKCGPMVDTSRDLEWLRLVQNGMGYLQAAEAIGYAGRSVGRIRARLTDKGHVIPPSPTVTAARQEGARRAAAARIAKRMMAAE